jgi:hypothetical protein
MMRQLKFRIWNGTRFVTTSDAYIKTSDGSLWDYDDDHGVTFSSGEKLWSAAGDIEQFTGMKTTSGKEVYEGDILAEKHDGGEGEANIGHVFFAAGSFMINGDGPLYDHIYSLSPDILEDYEVIGNIHENPELLK